MKTRKIKQIDLGDDFGDVTVTANGACVKIYRDGGVLTRQTPANDPAADPRPGQLIPGKGVFIGTWSPADRDGKSLNKTFNLFAAPYDLGLDENGRGTKLVTTYNKAVAAVGEITNLMGFAGFKGKNDTDLYNALRDGSYKGEWFMPTRDILHGKDVDGNAVQNDHLFGHRNTGALAGTFTTVASGSVNARWYYWSCTEHASFSSSAWNRSFTDGVDGWLLKDNDELSVRCVRAELVAQAKGVSHLII